LSLEARIQASVFVSDKPFQSSSIMFKSKARKKYWTRLNKILPGTTKTPVYMLPLSGKKLKKVLLHQPLETLVKGQKQTIK
jgi:hypothetical protein